MQARRKPQRGPGKHFRGDLKHFHGPFWGNFFEIFFSKWYILAYFYFWPTAGTPNVAGPGVATPPSRRAWQYDYLECTKKQLEYTSNAVRYFSALNALRKF